MEEAVAARIMEAALSMGNEIGKLNSIISELESGREKEELVQALGNIMSVLTRDVVFELFAIIRSSTPIDETFRNFDLHHMKGSLPSATPSAALGLAVRTAPRRPAECAGRPLPAGRSPWRRRCGRPGPGRRPSPARPRGLRLRAGSSRSRCRSRSSCRPASSCRWRRRTTDRRRTRPRAAGTSALGLVQHRRR